MKFGTPFNLSTQLKLVVASSNEIFLLILTISKKVRWTISN